MLYITKTPKWLRKLFAPCIWEMPQTEKAIYLTFDDGPHPLITPFVLDELSKYDAKATFFCIGKNVAENPKVFKRITDEGHAIGNHTYSHLDGWKTGNAAYLADIIKAKEHIGSRLFRPPYGRITRSQQKDLTGIEDPFTIVMWSVLSGDFDVKLSPEKCCKNVLKNSRSGSVVVFHDSEKAKERMQYALPAVLKYFSEKGFLFKEIMAKQ